MAKFQRPAQSGTPSRSVLGSVYPYLLPLLLFLAITGTSRQAVVGFVVVALVLSVGRTPWGNLRARSGWVTLAVAAYALVYLLSGLWCDFGAYAAQESTKMLAALAAGVLFFLMPGCNGAPENPSSDPNSVHGGLSEPFGGSSVSHIPSAPR